MRPYHFDFDADRTHRGAAIVTFERAMRRRWPPPPPPPPPHRGLIARLRDAVALVRLWRRRARERDQLARLGPHLLRDIGVTPVDVQREVEKPFWRA